MFQNGFYVSIRKTKKIDVDEKAHDLEKVPDLGPVDEFKVADYPGCPADWSKDGMFLQVSENQPLWIDFRGNIEAACLASVQKINPVTGEKADLSGGLSKDPQQNYLKLPDQLWLDGYVKEGKVYQFVVVTEGGGVAVNEVLLPKHEQDSHAMGFAFYLPKPRPNQATHTPYSRLTRTVTVPQYTLPGAHRKVGAKSLITQNRVADNYNCVSPQTTAGSDPNTVVDSSTTESFRESLDSNEEAGMLHASISNNASYDFDRVDSFMGCLDSDVDVDETVMLAASPGDADVDVSKFDQASMGAGGRIGQDVIYDNNTVEFYQKEPAAKLVFYFALPEMFEAIMSKGRRQDASKKDKYKMSGEIGGVQIPLVAETA
jgi:hypothetical protein